MDCNRMQRVREYLISEAFIKLSHIFHIKEHIPSGHVVLFKLFDSNFVTPFFTLYLYQLQLSHYKAIANLLEAREEFDILLKHY